MNTTPETLVVEQAIELLANWRTSPLCVAIAGPVATAPITDAIDTLLATLSSKGRGDPLETIGARVAKLIADGDGFWRPCSGCYETEDGQNVNGFPHSDALKSVVGGGCHECGGIGAVWDNTDYDAMARDMLADEGEAPQPCSPAAREACAQFADAEAAVMLDNENSDENGQALRAACKMARGVAESIARQIRAQTPPALSGGGELRETSDGCYQLSCHCGAVYPDPHATICSAAWPTDKHQMIALAVAGYQISVGLDNDAAWEDAHGIADAVLAALAQSTPAVGEGWREGVEAAAKVAADKATDLSMRVDDLVRIRAPQRRVMAIREAAHQALNIETAIRALPLPVVPQGGGL